MSLSSILSTIKTDLSKFAGAVETDAEKFAAAFVKIWKKAPSALQTVENFIGEVAPEVEAVVTIANPADGAILAGAISTIETGLAAVQAAATDANSGQSLLQNLENFFADVPTLLGAADVKDATLKAKIESIVTFVGNEAKVLIPAVEAWIAQIKASQPASA